MLYLSGSRNEAHAHLYETGQLGLLRTPRNGYRLDGVAVWALDNGAFTGQYPGDQEYLDLLAQLAPHRDRCLFVAAPDVVGDAPATLDLFPPMATRIAAAGWPVALVGQDGMENLDVPWHLVDWVFIGGSTDWKLGPGARELVRQARAHGKQVHVGRVNSERRFRYAAHVLGADTADGTFLAFGPDTLMPRFRAWQQLARQGVL